MTALAMFGFVVNDVFDYHKDAAAGVRRPIAAGELSIRKAVILAVGLLAPVFLLSTIVGSGGKVLAITSLGLVAYSPIAQRYPLGKGALVQTVTKRTARLKQRDVPGSGASFFSFGERWS